MQTCSWLNILGPVRDTLFTWGNIGTVSYVLNFKLHNLIPTHLKYLKDEM